MIFLKRGRSSALSVPADMIFAIIKSNKITININGASAGASKVGTICGQVRIVGVAGSGTSSKLTPVSTNRARRKNPISENRSFNMILF